MSGELTKTAAHGAAWTGISRILDQGLRFVTIIVLVRLLLPEDFGIVAMVAIVTMMVLRIVDVGFGDAIVQRKETTDSHISTAFWLLLAVGVFFSLVTVAVSPLIADFFKNELVGPVLAVSSTLFILFSLGSIHAALLRKRLLFFRSSIADAGGAIAYLVAAMIAAFAGFGVWSFVIGNIASAIVLVALRWILCGWWPSLTFSLSSLKDLWGFGFRVTGARLADIMGERLDYLIIGRFLTVTTLGFYSVALRAATTISDTMWLIVTKVSLPAFSIVQDEDERLRYGFLKSVTFISIVALPLFVGLAVVAPELVTVFFGQKWIVSIVPLQILCIAAGMSVLSIGIVSIFLAKGKPGINLKLSIAQVALLVPSLLIGVRFGANGVAIGVSAVAVIMWLARLIFVTRLLDLGIKDYLVSLRPATFGSLVMAVSLFAFRQAVVNLFSLPDVILLASSVLLGGVIYFITLKAVRIRALDEMTELALEMVKPYASLVMAKMPLLRKWASRIVGTASEETK